LNAFDVQHYLPMQIRKKVVLVRKADGVFVADNSELQDSTPGLAYRATTSLAARESREDYVLWGSIVIGVETQNKWVKVESVRAPCKSWAKCPSGHELSVYVTASDEVTCKLCREVFKEGARLWGCSCGYDVCEVCCDDMPSASGRNGACCPRHCFSGCFVGLWYGCGSHKT